MKQKKTTVLTILILMTTVAFLGVFSFPVIASAEPSLPDVEPIDIGPRLRNDDYGLGGSGALKSSALPKASASSLGTIAEWLTLDDYNGWYFFTDFELRAIGDYAEIWVQVDRSFPLGDPRNDPYYQDSEMRYHYPEVTDAQVAYLLDQYDTNIYLKDTAAFGVPDYHNGSSSLLEAWGYVPPGTYFEENGKNAILVANVRDDAYYDSSYPYYIAGFFSSTLEAYFDRNVITIDSHQWYRRVGNEGWTWDSEIIPGLTYPPVDRTNLYESVIAHELQHLIHSDYNPTDPIFMNEACSMFAEFLCDYPVDYGAIESFLWTPDNSLTLWGDQSDLNILADYGAVFLWAMYLYDQFGGDAFLSHFVTSGIPGIEGLNQALAYFGYDMTFDEVFHDWRIANLIRSDKPGQETYNYQSLDLSGIVTMVQPASRNTETYGSDFGETFSILNNPTGVTLLGTYGTDYIYFDDLKGLTFTFFDGDDGGFVPGWEKQGDFWWSGEGDLINTIITAEIPVDSDPANAFLELDTTWIIEDLWDYGFVQVATDGIGGWDSEWTSLENVDTTWDIDIDGHPAIKANLPGLTGSGSGVITFDLSAYAGQTIHLGFRFMTDWAFNEPDGGWWLYEALVSGVDVVPMLDYVYPEVDYMVTVVEARTHKGKVTYHVDDMWMFDGNVGFDLAVISKREVAYLIISPIMDLGYADYEFVAINHKYKWKW